MVNFIEISVSKRKERSKAAQIEEAYRIRDAEILAYEKKNPFPYLLSHLKHQAHYFGPFARDILKLHTDFFSYLIH